jgi:hypothetical protein
MIGGIFIIVLVVAWEVIWKLTAMWYAGKNNSKAWFIALAVINTIGILPILYLIFYTDFFKSTQKVKAKARRRK